MRTKRYKIPLDPYDSILYLIVSSDVIKTKNTLVKKEQMDIIDDAYAYFIYEEGEKNEYTIILPFDVTPGGISHEVSHLVLNLLQLCDVDFIHNDESLAYLVGSLTDKIWYKIH